MKYLFEPDLEKLLEAVMDAIQRGRYMEAFNLLHQIKSGLKKAG